MPDNFKRVVVITILICALVLAATGWVDPGFDRLGLGRLSRTNAAYLDDAFNHALAGFLILSGIKSGLAIIEGSSLGVGVNVQLGDIVQPIYDYVDVAWKAAMAGASIIVVMKLALQGLKLVDHWALALCLLFGCGWYAAGWIRPQARSTSRYLKAATRFCAALTLVLYLILPLTVAGAALVSQKITAPVLNETQEALEAVGEDLAPENLYERFFPGAEGDAELSSFDLKGKIAKMTEGVKALAAYLKLQTKHIAGLTLKLIAAYLFDCVVFPLFFGLILITMVRSGVGHLFEFKV